jgi:hypothetical protein
MRSIGHRTHVPAHHTPCTFRGARPHARVAVRTAHDHRSIDGHRQECAERNDGDVGPNQSTEDHSRASIAEVRKLLERVAYPLLHDGAGRCSGARIVDDVRDGTLATPE